MKIVLSCFYMPSILRNSQLEADVCRLPFAVYRKSGSNLSIVYPDFSLSQYWCFFSFFTVIICPSLDTPAGARKSGYGCSAPTASYGTTCLFSCKPGYESVNGSMQRTCQENQQWSGTPLECQGNDVY